MAAHSQIKRAAFFLGKGGVGKTTLSASFALDAADRGRKTLIVSLDPAHNLGDVLGARLGGEPLNVRPNLDAAEVDLPTWVKRYLDDTRREIKANYSYQSALNLDGFLNIMKYAPGTEEYAVLWAIEHVWCDLGGLYDTVVFDTPPTALSLRFLALPTISELWVAELSKLRASILKKRTTLLKLNPDAVVGASCVDPEDDKVYGRLSAVKQRLAVLNALFRDESFLALVINPDQLSRAEGARIREELDRLRIPISAVCMNKIGLPGSVDDGPGPALKGLPVFRYALGTANGTDTEKPSGLDLGDLVDHYTGGSI